MKRMTDKQKKHLMRKARQLAAADIARKAGKDPVSREVHVKAIRGKDAIMFQARRGYFSPRTGPVYSLSDLDIAEALDNPGHLVSACAKLGFVMLAQVLRIANPAQGSQALVDMADAAAKWLGIDVEALKAELAAERAEQAADEAAKVAAAEPTAADLVPTETEVVA